MFQAFAIIILAVTGKHLTKFRTFLVNLDSKYIKISPVMWPGPTYIVRDHVKPTVNSQYNSDRS